MLRGAAVCMASIGALVLAGCTSSPSTESTSSSPPSAASESPGASAPPLAPVALAPMPAGTAMLSWDPATQLVTAQIDMYGFTPNSSHAMHLHPGTCADQGQPPSVPLPDIAADAAGAVNQTVVSAPVPGGLPADSYLNIHLAPNALLGAPTDVSFTPIACADLPAGTSVSGPVSMQVQVPPKNGKTPSGRTDLTYDAAARTLRVQVTATGLPPDTAHAVHIHSGSCLAQGAVVYPLPDLTADGSGSASLTTTVDNVDSPPPATGWYVNVHLGPMNQILENNSPTLLFAPILCGDVAG